MVSFNNYNFFIFYVSLFLFIWRWSGFHYEARKHWLSDIPSSVSDVILIDDLNIWKSNISLLHTQSLKTENRSPFGSIPCLNIRPNSYSLHHRQIHYDYKLAVGLTNTVRNWSVKMQFIASLISHIQQTHLQIFSHLIM